MRRFKLAEPRKFRARTPDRARPLRVWLYLIRGASNMADEGNQPERRKRVDRQARFEEIRADLSARLRAVCADMAPADFEALVARMARVQLTYESESGTWNR